MKPIKKLDLTITLPPKDNKWVLCHGNKELIIFKDRLQGERVGRKISKELSK